MPAYSTLGKFNDPILNTMMTYGDDELASIMFHELSHQVVYIADDTSFNEAFAVTVEQEGLARWLKFRGREADLAKYLKRRARQAEGVALVARFRARARRMLYGTPLDAETMRARKAEVFARLVRELRALDARFGTAVGPGRRARRQAQQCAPGVARHLLRLRAGLRAAAGRRATRPAALLRGGTRARQTTARRAARRVCAVPAVESRPMTSCVMSRQLFGVQAADSRAVIIGRKVIRSMRNPFRARPKSFLDAARREWQFDVFAWLLRNCGGFPKFLDTTLVLPIEEHFPDRGMSGHAGVAALFRRVRDHAGMADWPCTVEPEPQEPRARRRPPNRIPVITYKPDALEPKSLVATFAHELARYLVETFEEPAPGGASLHEPAIDLAAVFMGFGVFMANSALRCRALRSQRRRVRARARACSACCASWIRKRSRRT